MRKYGADLPRLGRHRTAGPVTCWICGQDVPLGKGGAGKRHNRICNRPWCVRVQKVVLRLIQTVRERTEAANSCQFCATPPTTASKYCPTHQYLRAQCPGCLGRCPACCGRIRRNEGQGRSPDYCCKVCQRQARKTGGAATMGIEE